jgi:hypothetical protein
MLTKVYDGTPMQNDESLCETCRHSRIIRGRRLEEEMVFCDAMAMQTVRITFKVTTCTDYSDSREPGYHELLEKAWVLCPGSKRRAAGFVRGSDLHAEEIARAFKHAREQE